MAQARGSREVSGDTSRARRAAQAGARSLREKARAPGGPVRLLHLYITITARSLNPGAKIVMRAGQRRYAEAMRNAGADEVIIPEYEGGLMVARLAEQHAGRTLKLE